MNLTPRIVSGPRAQSEPVALTTVAMGPLVLATIALTTLEELAATLEEFAAALSPFEAIH